MVTGAVNTTYCIGLLYIVSVLPLDGGWLQASFTLCWLELSLIVKVSIQYCWKNWETKKMRMDIGLVLYLNK